MILELDTPTDSRWFASVTLDETTPSNSRTARKRSEDTSAEVLAYEIARYMPELAAQLANNGRRKLLAA